MSGLICTAPYKGYTCVNSYVKLNYMGNGDFYTLNELPLHSTGQIRCNVD